MSASFTPTAITLCESWATLEAIAPRLQAEILDERDRRRRLVVAIHDDQLQDVELELRVHGLVDDLHRKLEPVGDELAVERFDHLQLESSNRPARRLRCLPP